MVIADVKKVNFDYYIPAGTPVLDKNTGDVTYLSEAHIGKYPYPNNTEKNRRRLLQQQ